MIVLGTLFAILFFAMLRAIMQELERRDALFLNSTLRANGSLYLSDDVDGAWLTAKVLKNVSAAENETLQEVVTEPNWSLIQGTFKHIKDENFKEFLVAAGVPYLVRSVIVRTTPTVDIQYAYEDDDQYTELEEDYKVDDYKERGEGRVFQIIITTTTWIKTSTERFRPGYTFIKEDYDGTSSKNTYRFKSPTVLVHHKEKKDFDTDIARSFDEDGFVLTVIDRKTGLWAKRHYRRERQEA